MSNICIICFNNTTHFNAMNIEQSVYTSVVMKLVVLGVTRPYPWYQRPYRSTHLVRIVHFLQSTNPYPSKHKCSANNATLK